MYKISGNYANFQVKAQDADNALNQYISYISESDVKTYILMASYAIKDAMLVRIARSGDYSARLSGDALIALNDKYGLNAVSESYLDDKIIDVGIGYINKATDALKKM